MAKRKKAVDGSAFNAKKSQEPFKQSPSVEGFKGGFWAVQIAGKLVGSIRCRQFGRAAFIILGE